MNNNDSLGIYNGKARVLLNQYLLFPKDTQYIKYLVEEISATIDTVNSFTFSSGLLGIGWTISYISSQNDLPKKLAIFLSDFDDFIYKSITNYQVEDFSLENGIIGKGLYLYQRLKTEKRMNFYKKIALRECLLLIVVELRKYLLSIPKQTTQKLKFDVQLNILHSFCFLYHLKELNLNSFFIDNLLFDLKIYLIDEMKVGNFLSMRSNPLFYYISTISQDEDLLKMCVFQQGRATNLRIQNNITDEMSLIQNENFWFLL